MLGLSLALEKDFLDERLDLKEYNLSKYLVPLGILLALWLIFLVWLFLTGGVYV